MTSQDRDPGKIAKAFPSRAQNMMASLRGFDSVVRAAAEQELQKANELAAEGSARKTSSRSPSRPSAAMRSQLTGVTERNNRQGWTSAESMPHLCFPPDQYPQGAGPGSQWNCRCDAVWVADGIAWEEYPIDPSRSAQPLKPERWFYVEGGQLPAEEYRAQEDLYDWRPLGPYFVKLLRAMIDNQVAAMEGRMRDTTTWQELG